MLWMLLAMLLILVVAAAVVVYVAYPHRGEDVPHAPWLGEAMKRGVDAMPALPEMSSAVQIPNQAAPRDQMPDQGAAASAGDGSTRV
jgi:hypothetical protein